MHQAIGIDAALERSTRRDEPDGRVGHRTTLRIDGLRTEPYGVTCLDEWVRGCHDDAGDGRCGNVGGRLLCGQLKRREQWNKSGDHGVSAMRWKCVLYGGASGMFRRALHRLFTPIKMRSGAVVAP